MSVADLLAGSAQRYGLPLGLLSGVMGAESAGRADAVSPKGATGLMQLMPATAREMGVTDIRDPAQNIDGGAHYLRNMLDKFGGNPTLALAAYNAGPGRVHRAGGVPNIPETQNYVRKIMAGQPNQSSDDSDIFGPPASAAPSHAPQADGGDDSDIFAAPQSSAAMAPVPKPTTPLPKKPLQPLVMAGAGTDAVKSFGTGAMQGVTGLVGSLGDLRDIGGGLFNKAMDAEGAFFHMPQAQVDEAKGKAADAVRRAPLLGGIRAAPTSAQLQALRQRVTGTDYAPQSVLGEFARTAGQFLPAAVNPGSAAARIASVAVPAIASEGAGQLAKGTPMEVPARIAGGLVGGAFAPGMGQRIATMPQRAAVKPDLRVAQAIVTAARRDNIAPADLAAGALANPNRPAFHAGGENLAGLAEVAAQSPGAARQILSKAIRDDQARVGDEVQASIGSAMGAKGDFFSTLDAKIKQRSTDATSEMKRIGQQPVTLNADSVQALRSDLANSAVKDAAKNALASADPEIRNAGANLNTLADQVLDNPAAVTLPVQAAQDISKSLLDAADAAFKSGNGARGVALKGLGKAIRSNAQDPAAGGHADYGAWLKKYGDDSTNIEALETGRNVFSNSADMSAERLGQAHADWSDAGKEMYAKGVGEAVLAQARSKGGVAAMRQLLKSDELGDRVRLAFPSKAAFNGFLKDAEAQVQRHAKNSQVLGNSRTFGRAAAAQDLEAQSLHPADAAGHAIDLMTFNVPSLTGKAAKLALKTLPRRDRSIIGDPTMNAMLGNAVTSPEELDRLIRLLNQHQPPVRPSLSGAAFGGLLGR